MIENETCEHCQRGQKFGIESCQKTARWNVPEGSSSRIEREARLKKAAPKLLTALKDILDKHIGYGISVLESAGFSHDKAVKKINESESIIKAKAAIAEAEGGGE